MMRLSLSMMMRPTHTDESERRVCVISTRPINDVNVNETKLIKMVLGLFLKLIFV